MYNNGGGGGGEISEAYGPLPSLYLALSSIWFVSASSWTLITWRRNRHFQALLLLNYIISFSMIFHHISQNLLALQDQLGVIEDDDISAMHDAVQSKYIMFKKFQVAMQLLAIAETV
ncbi:hypothetical protein AKJ16_DCAP25954, partial [Drosera capensis]